MRRAIPGLPLAATFDIELAQRVGVLLGREARALGIDVLNGPQLDVARNPLWGRNSTSFGEDPLLAGRVGAAQIEGIQIIHLAREETIFGLAETDRVRELRFWNLPLAGEINQQARARLDGHHRELLPSVRLYFVAFGKLHAPQRCRLQRVLARFVRGRKQDFHAAELGLQDNAQSELRLGITHPTLPRNRFFHEKRGARLRASSNHATAFCLPQTRAAFADFSRGRQAA